MMENWREVPGHAGYQVSDLGNVRSVARTIIRSNGKPQSYIGQLLKPQLNGAGYLAVTLGTTNGRANICRVAVLVAAAFLGPRPPKMDVCHNDGDRLNNSLSNLRYGSRSENIDDQRRHGTLRKARGSDCGHAKLSEQDIQIIRGRMNSETQASIAKDFGVSQSLISIIKRGKAWSWLAA